jgi:hypothetical protein
MIVVLDTNIWKSQIYLQSPQAAATRFFLLQKRAKLGLPEVIKREVETHFKRDVLGLLSGMKDDHSRLLKMFGSLKELVLPVEADVDQIVSRIFENIGVEILSVPFSLASAQASFQKIIKKVAPSETKEQFKDGVIWTDCLELLKIDDVFLITDDKAFYKERDHDQGLAPTLGAELAGASHKLTLLARLTDLLSEIKDAVAFDDMMLAHVFLASQKELIIGLVSTNGFEIGRVSVVQRKLFATEDPHRLFVKFTILYGCSDLNAAREPAVLKVEGECRYDVETMTFDQFVIQGEELRFNMPDGTHTRRNVIFGIGTIDLGHKNVENIVRMELE